MSKIVTQKITPYLWFNDQAREAADFYCTLFDRSKVISDSGMIVEFELENLKFIALNGGPKFTFNESVSFLILCDSQTEVDHFWNRLTQNGGHESMCGWCKDPFGLSWQVVPSQLMSLMKTGTEAQRNRVMQALMGMKKILIQPLVEAHEG